LNFSVQLYIVISPHNHLWSLHSHFCQISKNKKTRERETDRQTDRKKDGKKERKEERKEERKKAKKKEKGVITFQHPLIMEILIALLLVLFLFFCNKYRFISNRSHDGPSRTFLIFRY